MFDDDEIDSDFMAFNRSIFHKMQQLIKSLQETSQKELLNFTYDELTFLDDMYGRNLTFDLSAEVSKMVSTPDANETRH